MAPGLLLHDNLQSDVVENVKSSKSKATAYLLDHYHPDAVKHAQALFNVILPNDPEIVNWKQNAEYLLVKGSTVSSLDVQEARKLRAIGKQGVGIDKIDAEACKEANIKIFNTPGANSTAVAELVLALIMAVAREIGSIVTKQAQGGVVHKADCLGQSLTGKSIGVLGMGNIGKVVARMFHAAFDAPIIAYDPFMPADAWSDIPHTRVNSVVEVLRDCDILTLHVPLTSKTRNLIGLTELRSMKPTAIVINAARGGIINEEDLCTALTEGSIWGAGLDCHEQEPPTKERYEKLWSHPRVISTPHIGAATSQAQLDSARMAVDRLYGFSQSQQA